jgi:hypothetical protein
MDGPKYSYVRHYENLEVLERPEYRGVSGFIPAEWTSGESETLKKLEPQRHRGHGENLGEFSQCPLFLCGSGF